MADIPAKLRQADITRFLNRGNQLRQFKPAITYWCEYWAVRQILMKQLHNADDECLAFTTNLMDQLEKTKTEHADEEAITDEAVGQALVEQFAQQTFDRAERTMTANKVTRQTADTLDAASTFFQLLNAWGPLDAETQKKVKYAKWNAARILRAIKDGEDPNDSNPKHEEPSLPELDPEDPDVQLLSGTPGPRPVTVEDDPDTEFYNRQTTESSSAAAQAPPALPDTPLPEPVSQPPPDSPKDGGLPQPGGGASFLPSVNDLGPPSVQTSDYFPPTEPSAPSPSSVNPPHTSVEPPSVPTFLPDRTAASPAADEDGWPAPRTPHPPPAPHVKTVKSPPAQPSRHQAPPRQTFVEDPLPAEVEGDIPGATKHARFAISALNFEDVPTAIKELRAALESLGAR
ncbi:Vta1 like-domain-containing protein [Plectosphaerella plurivora]|uniref:Vta1 like-domain-containing protein n=1 Tax=Plectosphaerella plurivora TaxID=936078 RepID=A0A9P9AFP4_9PEZI|nr:Vta1 like-domain-containing protein [Plectosphaerella plurivora]